LFNTELGKVVLLLELLEKRDPKGFGLKIGLGEVALGRSLVSPKL